MLDPNKIREIDIEIARLEFGDSSYPAYSKLADLYTIRNQVDRERQTAQGAASLAVAASDAAASPALAETVPSYGDSEFYQTASGKDLHAVLDILDDLLDTLSVTAPRVHKNILRKIREL